MENKRVFVSTDEDRYPRIGDLIRYPGTCNFINVVLEVTEPRIAEGYGEVVLVRSVRYGCTNGNDFTLLAGRRSKWIKMRRVRLWNDWQIVYEFAKFDNSATIQSILKSMEGVDTTWRPRDESAVSSLPTPVI